jgi:hypothetical protein
MGTIYSVAALSAAAAAGFEIAVQGYVAPDSGKGADNASKSTSQGSLVNVTRQSCLGMLKEEEGGTQGAGDASVKRKRGGEEMGKLTARSLATPCRSTV